jgi:Raf kinase inhibitor-like YbhB/YbcL family protein
MRIHSDSFSDGQPIPAEFAGGDATGFAANRNPQLAWSDVPAGTRSFAIVVIDPDVPTVPELIGRKDVQIPLEQARTEFVHWALADIPPNVTEIAAGSCSNGFVAKGKTAPQGPAGSRQGLNDYTSFFAGSDELKGQYLGYDGPYPPFNDLRVHRYYFHVFALDLDTLDLPDPFQAKDLLAAIEGHVLGQAVTWGTYTLNAEAVLPRE